MRHAKRKNRRVEVRRNEPHFAVQLSTRMQIQENRKHYKRTRDKKVNEKDF